MAGQGAANPAGITGVVTDNTGAILPGVTVTVTSPALQVPSVTSVSDERGDTACRRCRLASSPSSSSSPAFRTSGARTSG